MSSVTSIWPSQLGEAPIPIVGMFISVVMVSASWAGTHSSTTAKAPASATALASFSTLLASASSFP